MNRRSFLSATFATTATFAALALAHAHAQSSESQTDPKRKPDLADWVEGHYFGDVISDSRGSSQSGVSLTLTRIGKNQVQITSDYPRLPVVEVVLTQAMQSIVQANGNTAFVINRSRDARRLDVSFNNEVSWSGNKR